MYRPQLSRKHRTGAIVAVAAIHAGLALAFLNISGTIDLIPEQRDLEIFDISNPPDPPPEPPVVEEVEPERSPEEEGAASAENIRSQATPVVAPKPRVPLPQPPKVVASETPRQGSDPTQGASDRPGPGTGAGGSGTGTGSGSGGTGTGGGGGGQAAGVRLIRGITNRDYPVAIQRSWPAGGRIFLRLRIEPNGRPSRCDVMRSFGNSAADQWTCSLVMQRGQFRPATDDSGRPIAAWFGYVQSDQGRYDR